jgi:hypothetical protein
VNWGKDRNTMIILNMNLNLSLKRKLTVSFTVYFLFP